MSSTILTKVNKINLPFKDQINELRGYGDIEFLKKFVPLFASKSHSITIKDTSVIDLCTPSTYTRFTIYPKYIVRYDVTNDKKYIYKIS